MHVNPRHVIQQHAASTTQQRSLQAPFLPERKDSRLFQDVDTNVPSMYPTVRLYHTVLHCARTTTTRCATWVIGRCCWRHAGRTSHTASYDVASDNHLRGPSPRLSGTAT